MQSTGGFGGRKHMWWHGGVGEQVGSVGMIGGGGLAGPTGSC